MKEESMKMKKKIIICSINNVKSNSVKKYGSSISSILLMKSNTIMWKKMKKKRKCENVKVLEKKMKVMVIILMNINEENMKIMCESNNAFILMVMYVKANVWRK